MCTAVSYQTKDHYFGRNLDLEYRYNEQVVITPRKHTFSFQNSDEYHDHFAMIGMATVIDEYPLYYDATNEFGLSMAALNFPGNAFYNPPSDGRVNVASYELIPWVLCQCKTAKEAWELLKKVNITSDPIRDNMPPSPLHWILCDKKETIVAEPMQDGLRLYANDIGVLTNNPPFPYQKENLCQYMSLSPVQPENKFAGHLPLTAYSSGMGGIGLPGDLSSTSRFIRAAFVRNNSVSGDSELESIGQFFHILSSVEQQRGCSIMNGKYEITLYSSCCNTDRGIYYYTTYENRQISAVHLNHEDLNDNSLIVYPLCETQCIENIN